MNPGDILLFKGEDGMSKLIQRGFKGCLGYYTLKDGCLMLV